MIQISEKEYKLLKSKAMSYDEIDSKVAEFYDEENEKYHNGGLDDIGECVAKCLGYL